MIEFKNDAELWEFLLAGGVVIEKNYTVDRVKVKLVNGLKTYVNNTSNRKYGQSAKNCLLYYDYWVGIST